MKNYTIAIIGCGNMAQAILKSLKSENTVNICPIVTDIDEHKLATMKSYAETTTNNAYAVKKADYVLIAVKPQTAPELLSKLELSDKIIISIMAGVKLATLHTLTGSNKIIRVMPNLNAKIRQSYNAYAYSGITEEEKRFTELLLGSFGVAQQVEEEQLDAVTGLTGSSPAFVFMFIKSFIETGVSLGFSYDTARKMALSTIIGSAELIQANKNINIIDMIDSVCSKGGTTIEGVKYLKEKNFENITSTAIIKAVERAKELSAEK